MRSIFVLVAYLAPSLAQSQDYGPFQPHTASCAYRGNENPCETPQQCCYESTTTLSTGTSVVYAAPVKCTPLPSRVPGWQMCVGGSWGFPDRCVPDAWQGAMYPIPCERASTLCYRTCSGTAPGGATPTATTATFFKDSDGCNYSWTNRANGWTIASTPPVPSVCKSSDWVDASSWESRLSSSRLRDRSFPPLTIQFTPTATIDPPLPARTPTTVNSGFTTVSTVFCLPNPWGGCPPPISAYVVTTTATTVYTITAPLSRLPTVIIKTTTLWITIDSLAGPPFPAVPSTTFTQVESESWAVHKPRSTTQTRAQGKPVEPQDPRCRVNGQNTGCMGPCRELDGLLWCRIGNPNYDPMGKVCLTGENESYDRFDYLAEPCD